MHKSVNKGVVVAAGKGTRIGAFKRGVPKTLTVFLGIPLLERIIKTLEREGINEIIVVTGFGKEHVEQYFKKINSGTKITTIYNDEWEKSNGISVLKVKEYVGDEPFLLVMSDHLFDAKILKKLNREYQKGFCYLCVDKNIEGVFDIDDATLVKVEGSQINDIGKRIKEFNAVDTGVFLIDKTFIQGLEEIYKNKGDCTITDGVKYCISKGKMNAVDVTGEFWIDIDTAEDLKEAKRRFVKRYLYKESDGIISRNLNRKISTLISIPLSRIGINPDVVTLFVGILGLMSGYFASLGKHYFIAIGGILYQLTSILDGVDGELAKMLLKSSRKGEWIDTISDNLTYLAFTAGLTVSASKYYETEGLIIGLLALASLFLFLFISYVKLLKYDLGGSLVAMHSSSRPSLWENLLKRDFFALLFMVLSLFNMVLPILIFTFLGSFSGVIWHLVKSIRK